MKKILLSICIPTYNREKLLRECLDSIVSQSREKNIFSRVEIIISDNNSADKTREMVGGYKKLYKNIRYFRNKTTIPGDENIIKSAFYAKGDYIWFFGDDDIHYRWSLEILIDVIDKYHPDGIKCNLDLSSKKGSKILDRNMINLTKDVMVKTKKELFSFLETKFFMHLDWYITCQSNTIISRALFKKNLKRVMKYYNPKTANFLHNGFIFYNDTDYKIYLISKPLAIYRGYNMFGSQEGINSPKFLTNWHKLLKRHNDLICKINKKNISAKFRLLLFLKNATRDIRLILIRYFGYDISGLLIKLFHRKEV